MVTIDVSDDPVRGLMGTLTHIIQHLQLQFHLVKLIHFFQLFELEAVEHLTPFIPKLTSPTVASSFSL